MSSIGGLHFDHIRPIEPVIQSPLSQDGSVAPTPAATDAPPASTLPQPINQPVTSPLPGDQTAATTVSAQVQGQSSSPAADANTTKQTLRHGHHHHHHGAAQVDPTSAGTSTDISENPLT